jgi:hypothetical protein
MKRLLVCIGLCAALCAGLAQPASASAAPEAAAAKKKSNKKKLRQRARSYLFGEWNSGVPGGPVYTTVGYCTDGTYGYRVVKQNARGPSDTTFQGRWWVKSAGKTSATFGYTIENFQSVYIDGSPGPDSFPGSPATLAVSATSLSTAIFDGVSFSRGPGTCSSFP